MSFCIENKSTIFFHLIFYETTGADSMEIYKSVICTHLYELCQDLLFKKNIWQALNTWLKSISMRSVFFLMCLNVLTYCNFIISAPQSVGWGWKFSLAGFSDSKVNVPERRSSQAWLSHKISLTSLNKTLNIDNFDSKLRPVWMFGITSIFRAEFQ